MSIQKRPGPMVDLLLLQQKMDNLARECADKEMPPSVREFLSSLVPVGCVLHELGLNPPLDDIRKYANEWLSKWAQSPDPSGFVDWVCAEIIKDKTEAERTARLN